MKTNLDAIANELEELHQQFRATNGKRETDKLGSKGLVMAFRLAARHCVTHAEMLNFVQVTPHNEAHKSAYTNRLEMRLRSLGVRTHAKNNIRHAVGAGLKDGAEAAWDVLLFGGGPR